MKRWIVRFVGVVMLAGLVAVPAWGEDPPPEYKPSEYGSAIVCYPTCIQPNYIVASDFNADSWLDLAVSCEANSRVWTYANRGVTAPGVFRTPLSVPPGWARAFNVPLGPVALVTGQIINDAGNLGFNGFPDVGGLSAGSVPPAVWALQPNPAVNAVRLVASGSSPNSPVHMAAGNLDRADILLDFVVADNPPPGSGINPSIRVYTSGSGYVDAMGSPLGLPAAGNPVPVFVAVADFDQNGWNDIAVVVQPTNQLLVFYNIAGAFSPVWPTLNQNFFFSIGPFSPTAMDVGDFNKDGFPDIVVVGNKGADGYARVFLNRVAVRGFVSPWPAMKTWGFNTRFVEVLDIDGNGRDDFVTANFGSNTLTVFLTWITCKEEDNRNRRTECCLCDEQSKKDKVQFKKFKIELECGFYPTCLVGGDFDQNGKPDLAITLYSATEELCPQNPSCIEIIFDPACGFQEGQQPHTISNTQDEPQECSPCKEEPCAENIPPSAEIQTEGETKNP